MCGLCELFSLESKLVACTMAEIGRTETCRVVFVFYSWKANGLGEARGEDQPKGLMED